MTTTQEAIEKLKGGGKKTTEEAIAALKTAKPAAPESNEGIGNFLKNIDQALAQGIVKGVVSIPGLPGDIQQLIQSPKRETDLGNLMAALPQWPVNSGDMINAYEQYEQPFKTYAGVPAYAESAGEFFLPTPGGKAKVARDVATAIGGGVGAQSFEDLAAKMKLPPEWVSLLGGVLGVAAGAKGVKPPNAAKYAAKDAPSPELLKTEKDAAYAVAEGNQGLDRQAFAETVSDIAKEIDEAGVEHVDEPGMGPKIKRLLDRDQLNFVNLDSLAQRAGDMVADPASSNKAKQYGRIVLSNIDKYYDKLEATSSPGIKEQVARAKELGRANLLSQGLGRARGPGYLSPRGEELGEMVKARSYLTAKDPSLTPLEKEAAGQAVSRTSAHSFARNVGQVLKSGPAQTIQALTAIGSAFNPAGHGMEAFLSAGGSAGLGYAADAWADVKARQKLDQLGAVFRSGKEGQAKALEKAGKLRTASNISGIKGVLAAIRNEQAERSERNKKKKKASLPEVELPQVPFWPTTE